MSTNTATALNIPRRHGSTSSLRPSDNDLAPVTRSRRNSDSSMHTPTLPRPATQHRHPQTTIYASASHKPFVLDTTTLMRLSPFFKKLLSETPDPLPEQTTFEDEDDFAVALFAKYIAAGGAVSALHGPTDFHSTQHYLELYVLVRKWGCEELENHAMDTIRTYYAAENMTAAPYRLEYIYTYTREPDCLMRRFLIETAALRCTCEGAVSETLRSVVAKPEVEKDFMDALIRVGKEDYVDARHGSQCL